MPLFSIFKFMETNILGVIENAQFNIHFGHFIEIFEHDRKWNANSLCA